MQSTRVPAAVIKKIVDSGNPSNRIDVVFMGDGYTASEQTRFFNDIQRLTNEMFTGDTFAQYLPLFNIWAAYLPSTESGIGVGGKSKNTVFGLYRGMQDTGYEDIVRKLFGKNSGTACVFAGKT